MLDWLRIAADGAVLRRALVTAVIVGVILTVVNHGAQLVSGDLTAGLAISVTLNFLVPFVVSCVSSVAAIRREHART